MPQHPYRTGHDPGADAFRAHQPQHSAGRDSRLIIVAADIGKTMSVFDIRVDRQHLYTRINQLVDLFFDLRNVDRADRDSADSFRLHGGKLA